MLPAEASPSTEPPAPAAPLARRRSFRRHFAVGLLVAYTAALALLALLLRFVGEAWWVTTAGLYLPRIGFALPLPLVALALAICGPRRLLWLLPVPALLVLFPLMGLNTGVSAALGTAAHAATGRVRLVSYNISSADHAQSVALSIADARPDLVLIQEWDWRAGEPLFAALPGFHRQLDGQFCLLSRYPIGEVYVPPPVVLADGSLRSARFVRYVVETPLGPTTLFNVHPVSPRIGLQELRDELRGGMLEQLRGATGKRAGIAALRRNAELRWQQARAIAEEARRARGPGPLIIAGDTNLPGLSRIFADTLSDLRDGFVEAGRGFGYTFPTQQPWMRIDRILASGPVVFTRFETPAAAGSDHLPLVADLARP